MRILSGLLQIVFFLVVVWAALLAAGLISNNLPWNDPPGMGTRLITYLTTNVAETTKGSVFPELEPQTYAAPAALMFDVARRSAQGLKWELTTVDAEERKIEAVVTTKIIGFKDDVTIWVESEGEQRSTVFARSASRVGKGDLGANTRHLINLLETIDIMAPVSAVVDEEMEAEEVFESSDSMPMEGDESSTSEGL